MSYNPQKHSREDAPENSLKRRRTQYTQSPTTPAPTIIDLTGDSPEPPSTLSPSAKRQRSSNKKTTPRGYEKIHRNAEEREVEEKRKRRFRTQPPATYREKLRRAMTQRMFVISRTRPSAQDVLEEKVDIVGTTGNIYTVTITHEPRCTCPDAKKGNQCKHIIYVLVNVLKVATELRYQLAFLSSELREIFANCPLEKEDVHNDSDGDKAGDDSAGKRKPIEGDCPICFMEFEPEKEKIIWCKTSCGNNFHKTCFDQWIATTRNQGVRCVLCRKEWPEDPKGSLDMRTLVQTAEYSEDGYMNVARAVGLSGQRDYSSYNRYWVNSYFGRQARSRRRYYEYGGEDENYEEW